MLLNKKVFALFTSLVFCMSIDVYAKNKDSLLLSPDVKSELSLSVGDQRVLKVFDAEKISVVNSSVLNIRVIDNDEILLIAKKVGETTFLFWNKTGDKQQVKISVLSDIRGLADKLNSVLDDIENLKISDVGEKIVLSGELLSKEDYDNVKKVTDSFGKKNILNITSLNRGTSNKLLEKMLQKAIGVNTVNVKIVGDKAFLSGEVYSDVLKQKAEELVKTQCNNVANLIEVRDAIIEIDVMFLQVSKDSDLNWGQNLLNPSNLSVDLSGTLSKTLTNHKLSPLAGDFSVALTEGISQSLNMAIDVGNAKILSHPMLVTKSSESGHFHSGGDVYFTVAGDVSGDLKNVEYGLKLDVTPTYIGNDIVETAVSLELSVPTQAAAGQTLSLDKFSTENTVSCKLNESIVLSGLFENFVNKSSNRVPLIGNIPILSFFLNEKGNKKKNKELLVLLTPRITKASERLLEEVVAEQKFKKDFDKMIMNDPSLKDIYSKG